MNYKNKKIVVFGLEKSGKAVVEKLLKLGANVYATDLKSKKELGLEKITSNKIKFFLGSHPQNLIKNADIIIVSPGVPWDLPILKKARQKKIPVISEIEFAFRFFSKPIIAVTGTNGKSTTTALIGELLKAAGYKVKIAGNIGLPLTKINDKKLDFIVAEISSYQLEGAKKFRPWISIILNITPDHLTRHKNMKNYATIKAKIFANQTKDDYYIYNNENDLINKISRRAKTNKIPFSKNDANFLVSGIKIPGEHNLENSLAAIAAAKIAGVKNDIIKNVLKKFAGLKHRLEFVRKIKGISFINDSKATNPESAIVGIKGTLAFSKRIHLIAGGRDKGTDLDIFAKTVGKFVVRTILIGEAAERFSQFLLKTGYKNFTKVNYLKEAVKNAFFNARKGDVILLSPACASFDMFKNFEDRGRKFKKIVKNL
jgi:UDP-N-acetylmuramoylalanine--D-glutamate ligase